MGEKRSGFFRFNRWLEGRIRVESSRYMLLSKIFIAFLLFLAPVLAYLISVSYVNSTWHFLLQHIFLLTTDIIFFVLVLRGRVRQAMALLVYLVVPLMQVGYFLLEFLDLNLMDVPVYEIAALHCLVGVMLLGNFAERQGAYLLRLLILLGVFTVHSIMHISRVKVPVYVLWGIGVYVVCAFIIAYSVFHTGNRLHRILDERHQLVNRLSSSLNVQKKFFANISHEIRTPLNGIISAASLLRETKFNKKQQHILELLESSSFSLNSMLSNILIHNRLEEGNYPRHRQPCDIEQLIRACAARTNKSMDKHRPEVTLDLSELSCRSVLSDSAAISQIVNNLLENAAKFSYGDILLTAVSGLEGDGTCTIRISIRDYGPGVPEGKEEHIFDPYYQVDNGYNKTYQGAGLGLAVARELSNLLSAEIQFARPEGDGAEFSLSFKAPAVEFITGNSPPEAEKIAHKGLSVCIADDSGISRIHLEFLLQGEGFYVLAAENGEEALGLVEQSTPDLLILDMQMPVMDGFTCAERIRTHKNSRIRNIPILAVTGYSFDMEEKRMRALGIDEVLIKPFVEQEFLQKVRSLTGAEN